MKALKIVSGGQTGVDRAALDLALQHGIPCGGWCPAGRLDEFGRIPDRYPLRELARQNQLHHPGELGTGAPWEKPDIFAQRTLANVKDSDGTVVIYTGELRGGTEYTVECCEHLQRPHELINASRTSAKTAAKRIADFVRDNKIAILNVAGPRQSGWPEGYEYATEALDNFLRLACR